LDFSKIKRGVIYWSVGSGDSSTIVVDANTIIQVDLNKRADSEEEGSLYVNVVKELKDSLRKKDGKPYLDVFALTHPDEDHCKGFEELLENVTIGEIWFTPRVFKESKTDLCKDAVVFKNETKRRMEKINKAGGIVSSGDRIKLFGYDAILGKGGDYEGFPKAHLVIPGTSFSEIDGIHRTEITVFAHSPFKDDMDGDRNGTSLTFQTTLKKSGKELKLLHFGDLSYIQLKKIFDTTADKSNLKWNVLLVPHHCSKSAMYHAEDANSEETLRPDIIEAVKKTMETTAYIVSSSEVIPSENKPHDNPPHVKAKNRYVEIAGDNFLCTQEHPDKKRPQPIIFKLRDDGGIEPPETPKEVEKDNGKSLSASIITARGTSSGAPKNPRQFGRA
jgi:beta-lactamase superfamily II metal-dependent hydrolase